MRRSVLISIQPKWCELIASGKKTVEVRRSAPKLETPFKCYIYKTKKRILRDITHKGELDWVGQMANKTKIISCPDLDGGKVIGEFVCDCIDKLTPDYEPIRQQFFYNNDWENNDWNSDNHCLTSEELLAYGKGKTLFGWHITELKIYDKPKELGEFRHLCQKGYNDISNCFCYRELPNGKLSFCKYCIPYYEDGCNNTVTRPPQSWCYVEA